MTNIMSKSGPKPKRDSRSSSLTKQNSWSPDTSRESTWLRRKQFHRCRRTQSLTDDDFDELKGCIELGFGFSPDLECDTRFSRLSEAFPALGFYTAVNRSLSRTTSSSNSENDLPSLGSPVGSPLNLFPPGADPKTVKTKLRQWAQAVGCSVRQSLE